MFPASLISSNNISVSSSCASDLLTTARLSSVSMQLGRNSHQLLTYSDTNFVSYSLPTNADAPHPSAGAGGTNGQSGALGLGQQTSTGLSLFSQFFSYIMPLLGK